MPTPNKYNKPFAQQQYYNKYQTHIPTIKVGNVYSPITHMLACVLRVYKYCPNSLTFLIIVNVCFQSMKGLDTLLFGHIGK